MAAKPQQACKESAPEQDEMYNVQILSWGCRIENESCVTASNLFKYAFPCHGLVLFKHHNPLEFSQSQVGLLTTQKHCLPQKVAPLKLHRSDAHRVLHETGPNGVNRGGSEELP